MKNNTFVTRAATACSLLAIVPAMGVAQAIPSGGQEVVRAEWTNNRQQALTTGQMIQVSANGQFYATRTTNVNPLSIEIRRTSDHKVIGSFLQFGSVFNSSGKFFDISPDGEYVAIATTAGVNARVNIWHVQSGSRVASIQATWNSATGASAVAFSPNLTGPRFLAVAVNVANAPIRVYNVSPSAWSYSAAWNFDLYTEFLGAPIAGIPLWLNWSNDATRLAMTTNSTIDANRLRVWDTSNPATPITGFVPSASVGTNVNENRVFFNNSGSEVVLSGNTGFARFDSGGTQVGITTGLASIFRSFLFNAADTRFIGRPGSTLIDYDPNPNLTYTSPTAAQFIGAGRNSDSFIVAASGQNSPIPGTFELPFYGYTFGNPSPTLLTTRNGVNAWCQFTNILVVEGGNSLIAGLKDFSGNLIVKFNAATGQITHRATFTSPAQMNQLALSNDGSTVYIAMPNNGTPGRIERVNVSDLTSAGTAFVSTPAFTQMRGVGVVPTGPFAGNVYGIDDTGRITLFDPNGNQLDTGVPQSGTIALNSATLAMSPDGTSYYYGIGQFAVKMGVGATIGTPLSVLDLGTGASAGSIAVSPDSRRVALSRRVIGPPNLVFPLCYDNTVPNSFASLVSNPIGFSAGSTTITSIGITWLSNDYYAFPITTLGSTAFLQNIPLFASERSIRLDPILSIPSSVGTLNYQKGQQRIYFGGFWDTNISRHRMPEAPIIINKPDSGTTTATQLFGLDTVLLQSWGNTDGWVQATTGDFNGDGREDLVWYNSSTNQTAVWTLVGTNVVDGRTYSTGTWTPIYSGDFNGDGDDDILFKSGDDIAIWFMNGTRVQGSKVFFAVDNYDVRAVGDFNGDGIDDIAWQRSSTNQAAIWLMDSNGNYSSSAVYSLSSSNSIVAAGDLNGDGKDDLIIRNGVANGVNFWLMNGLTIDATASYPGSNHDLQAWGDFDGDGKTDVVLINTSNGNCFTYQNIATGNSFSPTTILYAANVGDWRILDAIDLNADLRADFFWRNTTTNQTAAWLLSGVAAYRTKVLGTVPATTLVRAQRS